jgi:hypothetical protein
MFVLDFKQRDNFADLFRRFAESASFFLMVELHMKRKLVEAEAVMKLMNTYYSNVYTADTESLRELFHEKAVMFGFSGKAFLFGTPEPFFSAVAAEPSSASIGAECSTVLTGLSVSEHDADASLIVSGFYGDVTVEDKFGFIKENGDWKIICKTFSVLG